MEDKIYVVQWKKVDTDWKLWVRGRPDWSAEGSTPEIAAEELGDKIRYSGGAMHPVFDFQPALPVTAGHGSLSNPEIFSICGGNSRFEALGPSVTLPPFARKAERAPAIRTEQAWVRTFFTGPICEDCDLPEGSRTDRPLEVSYIDSGTDAAFGCVGRMGGITRYVFSEHFLNLLTPAERQSIKFREVVGVKDALRRRPRFFELAGPPGLSTVAARGLAVNGWRCEKCRRRRFYCGNELTTCLAAADVPPGASMFTASDDWEVMLFITAARWRDLHGKKGARGLLAKRVGVVPAALVLREPELPTREDRIHNG